MQSTINLLRPAEKDSAQFLTIKSEAIRFTWILFIGLLVIGLVTIITSIIVSANLERVRSNNVSLKKQVNAYKQVESMLAVVKTRIGIVDKAIEANKPIDKQLAFVYELGRPPVLTSVKIDEVGNMNVSMSPISNDDVVQMVTMLISKAERKEIVQPRIMSYSLDKEGIRVSFSYTPVWWQP